MLLHREVHNTYYQAIKNVGFMKTSSYLIIGKNTAGFWSLRTHLLALLLISLPSISAHAEDEQRSKNFHDPIIVLNCPITPHIADVNSSPAIYSTNNLRNRTGSSLFAKGFFIEIVGRVLDDKCVPIPQTLVQIWQADDNGHYKLNQNSKSYLNDHLLYQQPPEQFYFAESYGHDRADKNFTGSGSAVTDNLGYYRFFTIIPGLAKGQTVPYISFIVKHKDFATLNTKMFFPEYRPQLQEALSRYKLSPMEQDLLIGKVAREIIPVDQNTKIVYNFDIVLSGSNQYLQY